MHISQLGKAECVWTVLGACIFFPPALDAKAQLRDELHNTVG
jgi:hypothetical protein